MKLRNLLVIAGIVAVAGVLIAVRLDRVRAREQAPLLAERPVAVRTARVARGLAGTSLTVPGIVEAAHGADLTPEVTARVIERLVESGDRVRAGQLLVRLESTGLAAELEGLRASASAAEAEAEAVRRTEEVEEARTRRDRLLYEGGAVSRESLELSEASLARTRGSARSAEEAVRRTAKAVEVAEDRLADTALRAPWDGEVTAVALDPGGLAVAGRPALRLVRDGGYRVDCRVPQEAAMELEPGGPATIEAGGRRLEAVVSRIGGGLDPSGLAIVELDVPSRPLDRADGASVRVTFRLRSSEGLTVPALALFEGAAGPLVYRLSGAREDGVERVEAVPVEVVLRGAESVAVAGGLQEGDRVVAEHPSVLMLLADGAAVQPVGAGVVRPQSGGGDR